MSKHTKGPWIVDPQADRDMILIGTDDYIVCEINEIVEQDCLNANLIAAAPVLLECLMYAVDNSEFNGEQFDAMARAAIKRAKGK